MIKIENLHKNFGKNKVLKGLDLELNHKGITAILGPNGSGKTTLLKSILGLVIPDNGCIHFNGHNIKNEFGYRNQISYLSQIARFPENLGVSELIKMMKDLRGGDTREEEIISMFGLEQEMMKKMNMLSGGTRQKVNLVISLMFDTPFIVLDEPSTGLDPLAMINFKKYIHSEKSNGKQIIITTHIMDLVEDLADDVIFLLEGKIYYQGTLKNLIEMQQEERLENAIAKILKSHA
jgi:Cu-processing system ATP-binding protein